MAELFSRYESGLMFTAGTMTGSYDGVSGINPIVDRLNSIAPSDSLVVGSMVSGTALEVYGTGMVSGTSALFYGGGNVSGASTELAGNFSNLTAGEGIDINNGSVIVGEDSSAGNKGIVIVGEGEGIDVSYSNGTATVSGENASTSNKGIASFNSDDFSVSSGDVSLKNKTSYWSCAGVNFKGRQPDIDDILYTTSDSYDYKVLISTGPVSLVAPVFLPNGVVVTAAIVNGNISDETWTLVRAPLNGGTETAMATGNLNSTDSSITNATIDNSTYSYLFETSTLDDSDIVYGAKITYTTDYD